MARLRQIITLSVRVDTHTCGRIRELAERALVDLTHVGGQAMTDYLTILLTILAVWILAVLYVIKAAVNELKTTRAPKA